MLLKKDIKNKKSSKRSVVNPVDKNQQNKDLEKKEWEEIDSLTAIIKN